MNKKILIVLMSLFAITIVNAQNKHPERIILNITEKPDSEVAVSWKTDDRINNPIAQIAVATDWTEFIDSIITFDAEIIEYLTDEGKKIFCYSVKLKNLNSNTEYVYRVGGDSIFSEWCQFKTAKSEPAPFQFIYFGDPQTHNKDLVTRVLRKAHKIAPESGFWLFAGDLINEPEDSEVEEFFFAGTPFFREIPIALAPGNHDRKYEKNDGEYMRNVKGDKIRLSEMDSYWYTSFTLPQNGLEKLEETSYHFDYQGAKFVVINSNFKLDEQAMWLDTILNTNKNKWIVVTFHHPVYSAGKERNDVKMRDRFLKIFDKYGVDLVLTGHDHAYARSYKLYSGKKVNISDKGTVYVVSVAGPKMYSVNSAFNDIMAKTGGYKQLFQVIEITGNTLIYKSYTATGKLFDSFELIKP